ncbi:MAG: PEP-CTERM sorting domain-containing protein [Acetobacteraceae bacterium]|nr:PEP-CTERM sorting domain-containing protein [Acetobacteraceae bacterium]
MIKVLGAASVVLGLTAASVGHAEPISYVAALAPENNSGVSGTAQLTLNDNLLTVHILATGLVPDQMHMSHIHGLVGPAAPNTSLPPPTADTDHDGYIEVPEATPYVGPPIFDLPQTLSPKAYSTAPGGVIDFTQTYDITDTSLYDPLGLGLSLTPADILGVTGGNTTPLVDRVIELHGENVPVGVGAGTPGEVHGQGGYIAEVPVAAGFIQLVGAGGVAVPEPGTLIMVLTGLAGLAACGFGGIACDDGAMA